MRKLLNGGYKPPPRPRLAGRGGPPIAQAAVGAGHVENGLKDALGNAVIQHGNGALAAPGVEARTHSHMLFLPDFGGLEKERKAVGLDRRLMHRKDLFALQGPQHLPLDPALAPFPAATAAH